MKNNDHNSVFVMCDCTRSSATQVTRVCSVCGARYKVTDSNLLFGHPKCKSIILSNIENEPDMYRL